MVVEGRNGAGPSGLVETQMAVSPSSSLLDNNNNERE